MPGEAPPAMIEIDAVGAIAILCEKRSMMPYSAASGHGPRSSASLREAVSAARSEKHTSELQSLMRISYAVFCLKKKRNKIYTTESMICDNNEKKNDKQQSTKH